MEQNRGEKGCRECREGEEEVGCIVEVQMVVICKGASWATARSMLLGVETELMLTRLYSASWGKCHRSLS